MNMIIEIKGKTIPLQDTVFTLSVISLKVGGKPPSLINLKYFAI